MNRLLDLALALLACSWLCGAEPAGAVGASEDSTGRSAPSTEAAQPRSLPRTSPATLTDLLPAELYRSYCGACHSLEIVESQRLDRANWEWVLDDMIEQYKAEWIRPEEREAILNYLVEHLGPE